MEAVATVGRRQITLRYTQTKIRMKTFLIMDFDLLDLGLIIVFGEVQNKKEVVFRAFMFFLALLYANLRDGGRFHE